MAIRLPELPGEKEGMIEWAAKRLPIDFGGPERAYPIAVYRAGVLAAVCVYHNYRGANLEMSIAADTPRWASRETITFLIGWPFLTHPQLRRVTAICRRNNKRSRKLVEGIGFRCEGTALDLFDDDDGVIYGLTRRWWSRSRWFLPDPQPQQKAA